MIGAYIRTIFKISCSGLGSDSGSRRTCYQGQNAPYIKTISIFLSLPIDHTLSVGKARSEYVLNAVKQSILSSFVMNTRTIWALNSDFQSLFFVSTDANFEG